jgi:hypothetical protein
LTSKQVVPQCNPGKNCAWFVLFLRQEPEPQSRLWLLPLSNVT